MTVKRYTPESDPQDGPCSIWMEESVEGTYVTYSDYQKLVAENAAIRVALDGVNSELYGKGFEVLGWHLNGDTEKLDAWFEDNDWDPETPATDAAIAEIKAQGVDEFGIYHNFNDKQNIAAEAKKFAANLRDGRKG